MTTHKCVYEKEISEAHTEIFGNGRPGLKYDYIQFKTSMKTKMNIMSTLFGLQFTATVGVLIKLMLG